MIMRALCLCLLGALLPIQAYAASDNQTAGELIAAPSAGHRGDVVYLSGGKFPPRTQLTIVMACPDLVSEGPARFSQGLQGPTTDEHGQFVGFPLTAPMVPGNGTIPCSLYAFFAGGEQFAQLQLRNPTRYTIVSDNVKLGSETTNPSLSVGFTTTHGSQAFKFVSWPGASLDLWILYLRTDTDQHVKVRLGWDGTTIVKAPRGGFLDGKGIQPVRFTWVTHFQDRSFASTTWVCLAGQPMEQKPSCGSQKG